MTKAEAKKLYEDINLTERDTADLLDMSRGKLRKALDSDPTPTWFEYALKGLAAKIDSGDIELEDEDYFKNDMVGTKWTQLTARQAVPILIEHAKKGKTLTYGELDEALAMKHPERGPSGTLTKYAYPLGAISCSIENYRRNTLLKDDKIDMDYMPPLTTIVVRKDTNMPGVGLPSLVRNYLADIDSDENVKSLNSDRQIEFTIEKIFEYGGWEKLVEFTEEAEKLSAV